MVTLTEVSKNDRALCAPGLKIMGPFRLQRARRNRFLLHPAFAFTPRATSQPPPWR